ncbi:MAG: DUF5916 domain-containing protein [Bacteroidota bacterium]
MRGFLSIFLVICVFSPISQAQNGETQSTIHIKKTTAPVILDGVLDDEAWKQAEAANNFWQNFPVDTLRAQNQTEIYMTYDETYLYVGFKCYASNDKYVTQSLRRDYRAGGSDNITILFDTFNDGMNSFVFGMNPFGVRREALIANGGQQRSDFNTSWDNKWKGEAKMHEGYWIGEMAIPFKTLRFKEGSTRWRFNSYRFDTQTNERSTWQRIPQNQIIMGLAFMGEIVWDEPLKKPGPNISLIPFIASSASRDFAEGEDAYNTNFSVGGDAKVGITSGLNLDLTVLPDFAQVEVDQQVINLDRFEIFFPERRQFFLENADLFASFGSERVRPFFSRRIGVARDTTTGQNIENDINFGARLSGKITENLRVGFLNMQAASDKDNDLPSFNYTVAALQQRIFSRSNLSFIFVNKQELKDSEDEFSLRSADFNRLVGTDFNLANTDNSWTGKLYYHRAITPESVKNPYAHGARLTHIKRKYELEWSHELVGEGFDAEVGFVPRTDYFRITPTAQWNFYNDKGIFTQHGPGVMADVFWGQGLGKTDHEYSLFYSVRFRDNSQLLLVLQNQYTFLFNDFDPTRTGGVPLPTGSDYTYSNFIANISTNENKPVFAELEPYAGQFFNGTRYGVDGTVTFRLQPYSLIALNVSANRIKLPEPHATANLFLIGPRIDLTFTRSLFLTTFVQYNNQLDNVNLNARFQWRFAPASDFFIVYRDNYLTNDWSVRNRALIAKFTYWLNV